MKAKKNWILIALLFFPAINVQAWPIPDTGQTKCYNDTAEIPCPVPGEAFYGQDGSYTINRPSYTKLDATGNALPDSAEAWTMVRDNLTGLVWENKTNDVSIHKGTKTFTWCDTNPLTNHGNRGTCGTGTGTAATDTEAFVKAINDSLFGGFSDWRLPTINELSSLINSAIPIPGPTIDTSWFPNTTASYYWSSTPLSGVDLAWLVDFRSGDVPYNPKANKYCVRVVRSGQ